MNKTPFLLLFTLMLVPVGLSEAQVATPDGSGEDLVVSIAPVTQSNGRVTLTAIANADDNSIGFSWSQIDNEAPAVRLQNAEKAIASFRIPFAVMEQTVTMSFSVHVTDGQDSATETIDVPVTLTVKPSIVLPPPESPSGFVETVLLEQQWDSTDGWTLDSQWGIESPMDTLLADTNNRVISIGECNGSCPLQVVDEVKLFTYDGADLVFWVWFGDQILDTDSLNTEVMMVQARTADNWEDHHMVTVSESAYEQWFPVTINFDEFAGDDFFFRFMPILENDNSIIQIDAIQLIAKTRDDVKPVISNVPNDIILDVSRPSLVTFTLPTAVDNVDGTVPVICDPPGRVVYPFGTTTVTCISRDSVGNTASASFDVTLNRFIPLEITAPDDLILEATGELTLVDLGTASINRDAAITNDAPDLFTLGSTAITWTAQDDKGDTANDTQIITIQDTTDPVIIPPDDIIHEATSLISMIQLGVATATDTVDAMPTITSDAPTSFPIGITIITYTATDDSGNSATATQKITIRDTGPKLILPSDVTAEATGVLTPVDIGTATVTDNIGTITVINDAPDSFPVGETRVTWTAKDSTENEVTGIQTVIIRDTTQPTITVPDSIIAEATDELTPVDIGSATASDIADSDVTVTNDSPDSFPVGSTVITWTATDDSGNTASDTQTVRIQDTTEPVFTSFPEDITVTYVNRDAVEFENPTATDIFPVIILCSHDSGNSFPAGSTLVTCMATDANSNSAQDSFSVIVMPPVIAPLPDPVLDLSATNVTSDSLTLFWTQPDLNGGTFQTYRLVMTTPHGDPQTFVGLTTEPFFDVTDLTPDTDYSFRVQARTDNGFSGGNAVLDTRTLPLPDPVLDLSATNITSDSLTLFWTQPDLNGGTLQTYRLVMTTPHGDPQTFVGLTAEPFFEVAGLTPDTDYSFRVQARTDNGFSGGNAIFDTRTLPLPDPVLDLSATNITSISLILEWTQPDLNGGTFQTYRLVMTTPHGDPQTFVGLTAEPFFEVAGLTPDTDYSFRVQARTNSGYSAGNAILDTRTLPVPPPDPVLDLSATNIASNFLRLEWIQPDLNGGTFQTYRLVMTTPHGDPQTFVGLTAEPFFDVTDLTPDTDYSFRVQARTDSGSSAGNAILDTTTLRDTTKPVFTSFPDDIAVRSTNDTFVEFASPTATDLHPVTIQCNHNSGDLFFIGTTLVTCTATDTSNNFVQDSFSITVYLPSGFETITDGFNNLNSWESFKSATPKSEASLSSTNDRVIFPVGSDSFGSAVLIRGQGIGINVGIQRDLSLENYNPLDPLYLGIDYRALSDNRYSNITNAVIEVQDTAGNSLHRIILFEGATFDSGWRTFSTDISQHVSEQDDIRVQLYLIDTWIDDWNQRAFFDNFYLGVDPPPT